MTDSKKRVLIFGVSGLLGNNLAYCWRDMFHVYGVYHQHAAEIEGVETKQLNALNEELLKQYIHWVKPDVIVNCAALANIDYCEENPDEAKLLNIDLVKKTVNAIKGKNIKFIHFSTDNVFDGTKGGYTENDAINPVNVYGHTKYAGELEALKNDGAIVARTNIFGWNIQEKFSLAEWCISELSEKRIINGFTDVYFSSIYTFDLADILHDALKKNIKGVYHMASSSSMSKYEFLVKVAELFKLDARLIKPALVEDFPFKAKRPRNLSLCVSKLSGQLEKKIPPVIDSLNRFYSDNYVTTGLHNEN